MKQRRGPRLRGWAWLGPCSLPPSGPVGLAEGGMSSGKQQAQRTLEGVPRVVWGPHMSPIPAVRARAGRDGAAEPTETQVARRGGARPVPFHREETGSGGQGAGPRRTAGPGGCFSLRQPPRLRPLGHPSSGGRAGPGTQGHGWRDPPGSEARSGVRRQPACCGMGRGRVPAGGGGGSLPCTDVETGPREEWSHTAGLGGHPWPHPVREPGTSSPIGLDHG